MRAQLRTVFESVERNFVEVIDINFAYAFLTLLIINGFFVWNKYTATSVAV